MNQNCNHRMGGSINSFWSGHYTDRFYSVIKHRLPSGGLWVRRTRCGEEWHPVNFPDRKPATLGWEDAICFETSNFDSAGVVFATSEVSAHAQIEKWCRQLIKLDSEHVPALMRIEKLSTEKSELEAVVSLLTPPVKFFERLKFALKIIRGN